MSLTDLEFVRRARDGDEDAYHRLVDRYANTLFRLAFSLVGNAADAEDVVQETITGAFRGLEGFEERSTVKTWLTRILVRQSARCLRGRSRRKAISLDRREPATDSRRAIEPVASPVDPGMRMDVMATLESLSPEHREVLVLREMQGMSYDEIARALGVPQGTVESRLFRARREMRDLLKDYLT